ncbi:MAG TPA: hypothetical protein VMB85_15385, partial [Bryobacteraceae bacterium]|nr:hypothetical protein [Bryobacteraceae bacterium]
PDDLRQALTSKRSFVATGPFAFCKPGMSFPSTMAATFVEMTIDLLTYPSEFSARTCAAVRAVGD